MQANLARETRKTRRKLHQTQPEMAALLGVSVHTYRNWEQGKAAPRGFGLQALQQKLAELIKSTL